MSYSGHVYERYTDEEELLIFLLTELEPLDQDRGHLGIGGFGKPETVEYLIKFNHENHREEILKELETDAAMVQTCLLGY